MNEEQRAGLVDMGMELIYDYGFQRTLEEQKLFNEKKKEIATDYWGFGNNYAIILKHMKENLKYVRTVLDIGCCWGVYSHMFKEYNYVGLEESEDIWENDLFFRYYPHHKYTNGCFPFVNPGGDVFISSMSLGYGGELYANREDENLKALFLKEISKFDYGYTKTAKWVEELLKEQFEVTDIGKGISFWKNKQIG